VLDSVVAGATAAVAALAWGPATAVTVVVGIGVFILTLAGFVGLAAWMVGEMRQKSLPGSRRRLSNRADTETIRLRAEPIILRTFASQLARRRSH
jgi:hypothetical protein